MYEHITTVNMKIICLIGKMVPLHNHYRNCDQTTEYAKYCEQKYSVYVATQQI